MRNIVILWGAHASGKTEFCRTLSEILDPKVTEVILGDLDDRFKDVVAEKIKNLDNIIKASNKHIVLEGMRAPCGLFPIIADYLRYSTTMNLILIVSVMNPDRMLHLMKKRKQKAGRQWTGKVEEYWTESKLGYESSRRFLNVTTKWLADNPDLSSKIELRFVRLPNDFEDFSPWGKELVYLTNKLR